MHSTPSSSWAFPERIPSGSQSQGHRNRNIVTERIIRRGQEPVSASQESTVQAMPSSKSGASPAKHPFWASQVSLPSQASPLSQKALSGVWITVSASSSGVLGTGNAVIKAGESPLSILCAISQVSLPSQYCPLSHTALFGVWVTASRSSSQASTVHSMPSSVSGSCLADGLLGSHDSLPLQ